MAAPALTLTSAGSTHLIPRRRSGLWRALTQDKAPVADTLPVLCTADLHEVRSMFDYDASLATRLSEDDAELL